MHSTITTTSTLFCLERKEAAQHSPCTEAQENCISVYSHAGVESGTHTGAEQVVSKTAMWTQGLSELAFKGITAFMIRLTVVMDSVDLTPNFDSHQQSLPPALSPIPLSNHVNKRSTHDLPV